MVLAQTYEEEGTEVLKVIEKYFPKIFHGKQSIMWLHEYSTQKQQPEWAAFFFEDYCFSLITRFLGGWKGPRIVPSKRFDYQRNFVWDLKLESNRTAAGTKANWIILNDITATKRVIKSEAGIGYIIARANFKFDTQHSLRKWRDRLEKRKTVIKKGTRILKSVGEITDLKAIFIKNQKILNQAIKDEWVGIYNQGKNSNNSSRNPKYKIRMDKVPNELIIKLS